MSKDPAFLFYPGDWLGGTLGMTFEEKGAYIELLMLQFNRGHMTKEMILQTLGHMGGQLFGQIEDKFKIDSEGMYYNERLEIEIKKRQAYIKSRCNNVSGINQYTKNSGHMDAHTTSHMGGHMENENKDEEKKIVKEERNIIPPSIKMVTLYCKNRKNNISPREFIDHYEARGWIPKGYTTKMKDWQAAIRTWEKNESIFNKEKTINNKKHPPIYDDHIKYIWDEEKQRYVHSVTKAVYIP